MNPRKSLFYLLACPLALASCGAPANPPQPLSSPTYERALVLLVTQFQSPDPTVRANCVEALQVSKDPRAMDVIEQGLHDPEWVVRFASAMAAGVRKASTVRPVLNTLVDHDPSGSVRAGCIYALRQLGDNKHTSDLAVLLTRPDLPTRANAAMVIGMLGDEGSIALLQSNRNDQDIRVRFALTAAMARLGDEPSQQVIVSWAVNKFAEDQMNAMEVCGDLPPSVSRSPLLLGLQGVSPLPPTMSESDKAQVKLLTTRRQMVAARSLAKMRDGQGAKVALDNMKNEDPETRALAALALGEMLTSWQAPGLDSMLKDTDEGVRRAVAAAIIKIYARAAQAAG